MPRRNNRANRPAADTNTPPAAQLPQNMKIAFDKPAPLKIDAPFRWNPLDKSDYKKGYSPTFGKEILNFWSVLYGTKPTPLNIFSASFNAVKGGINAVNENDEQKLAKPMLQLLGHKIRAGMLDFSPFGLGRALDQLGRRINVLTNPSLAFTKWLLFPITLPIYILAKTINIVKGIVAGVITAVALPFLAIKYSSQSKKRAEAQGTKEKTADKPAESNRSGDRLPGVENLMNQFGREFNRAMREGVDRAGDGHSVVNSDNASEHTSRAASATSTL